MGKVKQPTTKDVVVQHLQSVKKGGFTLAELRQATGRTDGAIHGALRSLKKAGKVFEHSDKKGQAIIWTAHKKEARTVYSDWRLGQRTAHLQSVLTTWTKKK